MSAESDSDIYDLFAAAAAIDNVDEREAFIRSRCSHDSDLSERLRAMLAVRERADSFFEPADIAATRRPTGADGEAAAPLGRVGRFRLDRLVGRGGMGNVFLAYDEQLHRPAALKFPRLDLMGHPELLERFLREAQLAAQLSHPNLVEIYEVGVWGQTCFIASQWCDGGDLAQWLAERPGPQSPAWSAHVVRAVARAVAYCHEQGVVHLDIKPANIILAAAASGGVSRDELKPMLTDFGVARVLEEGLIGTHTSLLLGTPLYMAPEQAESRREKIGPQSDMFALGVILYEMLYGKRPFDGDSALKVLDQIRAPERPAPPARRNVPRELQIVCCRCLEYAPEQRYPSAHALAEDLDRFLRGESIHARPVSRLARLSRWLERPERMTHAGMTALSIHCLIVFNFACVLLAHWLGWADAIEVGTNQLLGEALQLALTLHLPTMLIGWMTIRRRLWSVPAGIAIGLLTAVMIGQVLFTGESPISLYDGHPLATFLMHLLLLGAIVLQVLLYVGALPAMLSARRRRLGAAAGGLSVS